MHLKVGQFSEEFEVKTLIHNITENRIRHASGPVCSPILLHKYIDGSRAVYCISPNFKSSQMNR